MPVAPIPPTKPTPPVAPTLTPAGSSAATDLPTSAATHSIPNSSKPVSTELSGTAKELDELGKAFQGQPAQTKNGEKSAPAAPTINKTNNIQAAPAAGSDSQAVVSAQTAVPTKPLVVDSKPSGLSYLSFIMIVGVIAMILVGLRLFTRKTKQQRTLVDYSKQTTPVMNKDGLDIVVTPQATTPKVKSNFEVRV